MWTLHWECFIGILALMGALLVTAHERRLHAKELRRDRRIREEFEAYASLDASLSAEGVRGLAKRVCRLVARKSAFQRVAMLAQDDRGRMHLEASVGMEENTIQALRAWGERVTEEYFDGAAMPGGAGIRMGEKGLAIVLGKDSADAGCGRAIIIPLQTSAGQMRGVLAVCADSLMSLRRQTVKETIPPLEALGLKLGQAMENAELVEQSQQVEKLAGHGLSATG